MSNLVIVESPAKANTIEKILGKDFKVVSSYGHIRDLEKKNMGVDLQGSFNPRYQVPRDKKKVIDSLIKASKKSDVVWLATDEDREGEAIAWHLYEVLELKKKNVNRIVFHEITSSAIKNAIKNPREIDVNLVNAQQARRILDRIVGFKLSPILWKKIKSGLSAGRVQSVAVRLIVEKEKDIITFKPKKSYHIYAEFTTSEQAVLYAEFSHLVDVKSSALDLMSSFIDATFQVTSIETKPSISTPSAPFTTSSLQQVASNKLGFSVTRTMSVAQKLYESGHITYMRTDSNNLSQDFIISAKKYIEENYSEKYVKSRIYATKTKVAQEAHEAIRPTNIYDLNCGNDDAQLRLYKLIWERSICSQMSDAIINKTIISIKSSNKSGSIFQAKGQQVQFDGYLRIQHELANNTKNEKLLPYLKEGEYLNSELITAKEKYSKSPARFTEASLVKKLEELGIGRPSTYAPTISTIQKREYVIRDNIEGKEKLHNYIILAKNEIVEKNVKELIGSEKKKLMPTEIGKLTNDFLVDNFKDILEYNFTANVENQFDNIARGKQAWREVIQSFYKQFEPTVLEAEKNSLKVTGMRTLGVDPETKKMIHVRLGKYGPIVQLGDIDNDGDKPRYAKLRKGQTIDSIDLRSAIELFSLPRNVGQFEKQDVLVSEGRYGPYIRFDNGFIALKGLDPFKVELETCVELIKSKREFEKQKIINSFNVDNEVLQICNGRYGPYIKFNNKNYKIPKDLNPQELTLQNCLNLIDKTIKK